MLKFNFRSLLQKICDHSVLLFSISSFCVLIFTFSLLQSCTNVAMTGCEAVYYRKSLVKNFTDHYITMRAHQALYVKTEEFRGSRISIATFNREVLMAGQAPTPEQKAKAEQIVKQIPNVEHVYNFVTIGTPSSTLTRMSDTWITGKIKARMLASDVDSPLKVVTENGIVYLMGTLPPQEAESAIEIARNTDGVQGVVKMFSYVTVSKHANEKTLANEKKLATSSPQIENADPA